jgi:predicted nuclease with TOPRIM domain
MWITNGKTWYSEDEYLKLKEKLKDLEEKYKYAVKQNNAVYKQYESVLAELNKVNPS